jgi:hypothetical protein
VGKRNATRVMRRTTHGRAEPYLGKRDNLECKTTSGLKLDSSRRKRSGNWVQPQSQSIKRTFQYREGTPLFVGVGMHTERVSLALAIVYVAAGIAIAFSISMIG